MIKQIDWQGTPAHVLENEFLIVSICPGIGNNVYSIWDKKLQRKCCAPLRVLQPCPSSSCNLEHRS